MDPSPERFELPRSAGQRSWLGRLAAVLIVLALGACLGIAFFASAGQVVLRSIAGSGSAAVPEAATTPAPEVLAPLSDGVNLLLVQTESGDILLMHPDGSEVRRLTSDATPQHSYGQPTWAPDARSVAWSELRVGDSGLPSSGLYSQSLNSSEATRVDTGPFAPFYIYFSPDDRSLAFLSNWENGLALRLAPVGEAVAAAAPLAQGQPLYFDWSPDSDRILAHVSSDHLDILDRDGARSVVTTAPGEFTTPDWLESGSLLYVLRQPGDQRLVLGDTAGRVQQVLAEHDGTITFTASPDGRRVAYTVTRLSVPANAFGPLSVVDVETGATRVVSRSPVIAFFWSPDGRSIAYLTPEDTLPGQVTIAQHEDVWLRWHVWDGDASFPLAQFVPSDTYLLDHLRWFDQYALSSTPWAPDSSAFVFAGRGPSDASGIWVQPIAQGGEARRVAGGVHAVWSPR
jgi:TolB protein